MQESVKNGIFDILNISSFRYNRDCFSLIIKTHTIIYVSEVLRNGSFNIGLCFSPVFSLWVVIICKHFQEVPATLCDIFCCKTCRSIVNKDTATFSRNGTESRVLKLVGANFTHR